MVSNSSCWWRMIEPIPAQSSPCEWGLSETLCVGQWSNNASCTSSRSDGEPAEPGIFCMLRLSCLTLSCTRLSCTSKEELHNAEQCAPTVCSCRKGNRNTHLRSWVKFGAAAWVVWLGTTAARWNFKQVCRFRIFVLLLALGPGKYCIETL